MNKLTKIGVSALCGSLAAVSAANAGELAVTGSATATWSSVEGSTTGNPIGIASDITYKGSGELDNGTTFSVTIDDADKSAFSAAQISMDIPGVGVINIDQGGGTGIDRYDDMMPTAWEEVNGTAVGMGLQTVSGAGGSTDIEWGAPAGLLPDGMTAHVSWAPAVGGTAANDKGQGGDTAGTGDGVDVAISHTGMADGLKVFLGYSEIDQSAKADGDRTGTVAGFTYAVGGFTLGYQVSKDSNQTKSASATSFYDNQAYGISFAVNDDLSISYGSHKSEANRTNNTSVELEGTSIQLAYTMGGATIKIAETSVDNASYSTATSKDIDGTTLALSLAF